jgi:hypothetical protein
MKPIIFTGDSFTFGEGLELYDERYRSYIKSLTKIPEVDSDGNEIHSNVPNHYYYNWPRFEHMSYGGTSSIIRHKYKFPTLVSENLNTLFFSKGVNGGDNIEAFDFINEILESNSSETFSCIVLNLTGMNRDDFQSGKKYLLNEHGINCNYHSLSNFMYYWFNWDYKFKNAPFEQHPNEFNEFFKNTISIDNAIKLQQIYGLHSKFEYDMHLRTYRKMINIIKKINIPVYIIGHWNDLDNEIFKTISEQDVVDYIKNKIIPIKLVNTSYNSLCELPKKDNLWISDEFKWTQNNHPSKELHQIIADSVTHFLKQEFL